MSNFSITSPSPATPHQARFDLGGEIRFGPFYYSLSVDDRSFGYRIFGEPHVWSISSALLAVQEWHTTDYGKGPITSLLLIDAELRREATIARATKQFLVPDAFTDSTLLYYVETGGQRAAEPVVVNLAEITEWTAFG